MVIIEREGKYFLQISNGELELSEDQAKLKLEKGQAVLKGSHEARLEHMSGPETDVATEPEKPAPISEIPREAQAFILSDEYYDNIIREFERSMWLMAVRTKQLSNCISVDVLSMS